MHATTMSLHATVLFDTPRSPIASIVKQQLESCESARLVTGFLTSEGIRCLEPAIAREPGRLKSLIVGAGTFQAYSGLDRLLGIGVSPKSLLVNLGMTRLTKPKAKNRFYRYHPMLHSKIYYFEHSGGLATAIVGSHNVTGFALMGMNGEAAVRLDGPSEAREFQKIRDHIQSCITESVQYERGMKEAFSWWTHQFMEGLSDKANDLPKDAKPERTILILAGLEAGDRPRKDDVLYFEIPRDVGTIQSLKAEVHVFLFESLPASPMQALMSLGQAKATLWARTLGLEMEKGGVELRADWYVDDNNCPIIRASGGRHRPRPGSNMQQVRAQLYFDIKTDYEYLFESPKARWIPVLADREEATSLSGEMSSGIYADEYRPNPEHLPWSRVVGLKPDVSRSSAERSERRLAPESGSYVLMSTWRRERDVRADPAG